MSLLWKGFGVFAALAISVTAIQAAPTYLMPLVTSSVVSTLDVAHSISTPIMFMALGVLVFLIVVRAVVTRNLFSAMGPTHTFRIFNRVLLYVAVVAILVVVAGAVLDVVHTLKPT